jgi:hypothetical protein
VRRLLKFLISIPLFGVGGCGALVGAFGGGAAGTSVLATTAGAATTSVPSIVDQVEPSTRLAMLSPAALLDSNSSLDATIVDSQCRFRTADPPFLVPTIIANKSWTFTGRVNEGKSDYSVGHDAQALEYRSWFGFGTPKQQLNTWPVSMVTLSEMPREYLDDRLTMLSDHTVQVNKTQTDALTKDYINDAQRIQDRVEILVFAFSPDQCPTQQ